MRPHLPIADGAHRRQVGVQIAARAQPLDLRDEAVRRPSHRSAARFAPRGPPVLPAPARRTTISRRAARRRPACCSSRDRLPGQRMHLERALDALPVARRDPRGGCGVHVAASRSCSAGQPCSRRFAIELGAHGVIGARQRREAVAQRAQIEHRAADEQRQSPARTRSPRSRRAASRAKRPAEYASLGSRMSMR